MHREYYVLIRPCDFFPLGNLGPLKTLNQLDSFFFLKRFDIGTCNQGNLIVPKSKREGGHYRRILAMQKTNLSG